MFCGKCGAQNADGASFCTSCGAQLDAPVVNPSEKKQKKVGIIATAVVAVLAVILVVVLFFGRSANATAKAYVRAILDADAEEIVELLPREVREAAKKQGELTEEDLELMEDMLEGTYSFLEIALGEDWQEKISYKVVDSEDLDKDDVEDLEDMYRDEDIDINISAAREVEVELSYRLDGEKETNSIWVTVIKVGRSWYLDLSSM